MNIDQFNIESSLEEIDIMFLQRVLNEVQVSCALPLQIPMASVVSYIWQAAQWFWENDDSALEERSYQILNRDINKKDKLNKTIKLPPQIYSVHGVFKTDNRYGGVMGDFSLERIMMSNYSYSYGNLAGAGSFNGGSMNWSLTDVVGAMYELSTFDDLLNTPLTYNYNRYSNCLVLLGDLRNSNLVINVMQKCKIHDLYNNYYFFRYCVCLVKRGLSTIYGTFEMKLPGGVTINYSNFSDQANEEIEKIEEKLKESRSADYFFLSNNN